MIGSLSRPLQPDELRESLRANIVLAKLQARQTTIELAATSPDLLIRDQCAREFRELFGFDPAQVEAVKQELLGIRQGTGRSVAAILRQFQLLNGTGPCGAESAASSSERALDTR